MHILLRKSLLHRNHFFGWLKAAVLLFDCGTVTLESPLLRAFFTPHVHPRPRKRLSRCTLDCGFKTSESPALRGFVGGPRTLATAALYLVLLSNGLHHSENLPVKFGFSPKIVPANIVQKLPSQLCSKPLFIAFFNFSHKRPTFAFSGENAHTRLCSKDRTQRLTRRNRGLPDGAAITTLDTYCTFTNIPGPGTRAACFAAFGSWPGGAPEERREPSEQRCAHARRCSEASRPRWAA